MIRQTLKKMYCITSRWNVDDPCTGWGFFFFWKGKVTHRLYRRIFVTTTQLPPLSSRVSLLLHLHEFSWNLREAAAESRGSSPCLCCTHHGYSRDLYPLHRRISAVRRTRKVSSQLGRRSCCIQPVCVSVRARSSVAVMMRVYLSVD